MMTGRKIGTIAALGSSTAALAMMTGLSGARADDLQINQQILDTRIDQRTAQSKDKSSVSWIIPGDWGTVRSGWLIWLL